MCKSTIVAVLIGVCWLISEPVASGQTLRTFGAPRPQGPTPFSATSHAAPTVSPYLNLGYNGEGISNYQTLVRPIIEERDVLSRQATAIEQLDRRVGSGGGVADRREQPINGQPPQTRVRFMHYSHYFNTVQ